jgi:hypothetical protein
MVVLTLADKEDFEKHKEKWIIFTFTTIEN